MQIWHMKKTHYALLFSLTVLTLLAGCGKTPVTPVSDLIKKNWTPKTVTENGTAKYTFGATSNPTPGYSKFVLNLSSPPAVTWTTIDASGMSYTFTGTYALSSDNKTITLSGLTPIPTGSNGTVSFTITSVTDSELVLARTTADPKTGNSNNIYTLKNP